MTPAELDLCRAKARNDREAELVALDTILAVLDDLIEESISPLEIGWLGIARDDLLARQKAARPIRWWPRRAPKEEKS